MKRLKCKKSSVIFSRKCSLAPQCGGVAHKKVEGNFTIKQLTKLIIRTMTTKINNTIIPPTHYKNVEKSTREI